MNWFTRKNVAQLPLHKKMELVSEMSCCEHVNADANLLAHVTYENDSFGREGYGTCQVCYDEAQEINDLEEVHCADCGQMVQKGRTIEWRWYDFYAPQGDEPLVICDQCRTKPKHLDRVSRDRADYEHEMRHNEILENHDIDR